MKFSFYFNNNFLKTSYGANLFAICGLIFPLLSFLSLILYKKIGLGVVIPFGLGIMSDLLVSFFSIAYFILERFIKLRITNKFFKENVMYSIIFYLGFISNIIFFGWSIRVYFF